MSVRAYKIKEIEHEEDPTFNLWHDQFIVEHLVDVDQLDNNGGGNIEIQLEDAEQLLKELNKGKHDEHFEKDEDDNKKDTIETVKRIIKDAKKNGYVEYICF